jgi:DNA (cytosine-5)-methyltransferase 1
MKTYLVADLFCGAGGSSTGAEKAIKALGRRMTLVCVNHWPVAIETHRRNHPAARHYIEDLTVADPVKLVPEGYLDLLMASPECRFYSRARGGKPVNNQGRMNPWAVHRWLTSLAVRTVIVENVPEFIHWGPLLPDGRPDPKKRGQFFQAWFKAFWEMGYKAEWKYLNAADYGDATTRTRFFLIARKDRRNIHWPAATHSESGGSDMIGHRIKWRAAREIIDWNNTGRSLLEDPKYRKRPLSPKTLTRIAKGLEKFGGTLAPLYINLLGLKTDGDGKGEGSAFIMGKNGHSPAYRSCDQPVMTLTTDGKPLLIQPVAEPFTMANRSNSVPRSMDKPIHTVTAQNMGNLYLVEPKAEPFILGQQSKSSPRQVGKPVPTIATDGAIELVTPIIDKYYGTGVCHSIEEPLPTVTTKDRLGLAMPTAEPFIVQNRIRPDGDRVFSTAKPLSTVTGHGAGSLVQPFIVEVNHDRERNEKDIDKPLTGITSKRGNGLVNPILVQTDQTGGSGLYSRSIESPAPTLVTKNNVALVEPVITPALESGIDPRRLVLIDGALYVLDIRFRMLDNSELSRAMGFTDNEYNYEFVGSKEEVTKQIGNAVPVNLAAALVKVILE